jgi:hypothetical protein
MLQRWFIVAVAVVSPAAAALLYFVEPTEGTWYPRCLLHWLTGLHCPFCGTTRSGHALLNGDVAQAAAWNIVAVVLLPAGVLWLYAVTYCLLTNRPLPRLRMPNWVLWTALGCLITFAVVRNLPFYPFDLLAPHRL